MALWGVNCRAPKTGVQKLKPGACFLCGKEGHFKGKCPQAKLLPPKPCPLWWGDHWKRNYPQRRRSLKSVPQTQDQDLWGPGLPTLAPVLIAQELQVILTIGDCPVNFPLDIRASFSAPLSNPGPPSTKSLTICGISGESITKFLTQPLRCDWVHSLFSSFLIIPESPTSNLVRDILSNM